MKKTIMLLLLTIIFNQYGYLKGQNISKDTIRNILILTAHPDDWEGGMGGTAYLLKDKYHIHVLIATKGERGLSKDWKEPSAETAKIREKESYDAGKKINAQLHFLGQIDGDVYANKESVDIIVDLLKTLDPVMIFTRWGIDVPDHAAVSNMTLKALRITGMINDREVYFYEAQRGNQTNQFDPDLYVNISNVIEKKKELIRCHVCQNKDDILVKHHVFQDSITGQVTFCDYAESFKTYYPLVNARMGKQNKYTLLKL